VNCLYGGGGDETTGEGGRSAATWEDVERGVKFRLAGAVQHRAGVPVGQP
jgi:hypothetical protein